MSQPRNFNNWLKEATNKLANSSETPRLDAEVILSFVTKKNRAEILTHPETIITARQINALNDLLQKRAISIPIAYLKGESEFYGRKFKVTKDTLVPRPESEYLIEMFKELTLTEKINKVADIGTGCGALGITIKLENPSVQLYLSDISLNALKIAKHNCLQNNVKVKIFKADLLEPNTGPYEVLICNLPYVPDKFEINNAAKHEPRLALFGGKDGLSLYRKLMKQVHSLDWRPKYVFTESLQSQHEELMKLMLRYNYTEISKKGLIQLFQTTN